MPAPIITLTTDFGLSDPYVGAIKGAILSLNPAATIIDISHDVRPQHIEQGAFILAAAWPYFPPGSIHIAVVDPGVGSQRHAIALVTPAGAFLGPDNGVLSAALPDDARPKTPTTVPLLPGCAAHLIADPRFQRSPVSPTFHGRDIFAPAAAHLSLGVPISELGPALSQIVALPPFRASQRPDGGLAGRVLHIDHFGNLITDLRAGQLPPSPVVEIAGRRIEGLSHTYAGQPGLLAVIGSSGYVEIAVDDDSAAAQLGVDIGEPVFVKATG